MWNTTTTCLGTTGPRFHLQRDFWRAHGWWWSDTPSTGLPLPFSTSSDILWKRWKINILSTQPLFSFLKESSNIWDQTPLTLEWAFQSLWASSWTRRRMEAFPSSSTRKAGRGGRVVLGLCSTSTGSPSAASAPLVPSCPTSCWRWTTSARSCPLPWTGVAWPGRTGTSQNYRRTTLGRSRGKHLQQMF